MINRLLVLEGARRVASKVLEGTIRQLIRPPGCGHTVQIGSPTARGPTADGHARPDARGRDAQTKSKRGKRRPCAPLALPSTSARLYRTSSNVSCLDTRDSSRSDAAGWGMRAAAASPPHRRTLACQVTPTALHRPRRTWPSPPPAYTLYRARFVYGPLYRAPLPPLRLTAYVIKGSGPLARIVSRTT